ncbi:MAG: glycerol dehydrogenase [Eubacterium sp.]|nr:glycerol dehydrogenase [Eubacterium sp.]
MSQKRSIAFGSPSRYIQGPGEFQHLPAHSGTYGSRVFAVIDSFFYEDFRKELAAAYAERGEAFEAICFQNEITRERIETASEQAKAFGAEVILGIGGGKTLDTAKAIAGQLGLPVIVMPTSASTDAPTSAMSIIYNDAHEHADVYYYKKNPDMVIVDSQIIADAPVRFLVSGMGDALATTYEARASVQTNSPNYINQETGPYGSTITARMIAEYCFRIVLGYGAAAKAANEKHIVNEALEAVIEANTLMSGLGFENVGCAAAHVICNGLSATPNGDQALHGEKVAFGILCQLVAENAKGQDLRILLDFYHTVGLPMTLEDMGIEPTEENYRIIAADTENTEWSREPFPMNDEAVIRVVKETEETGKTYKQMMQK